MSLPATCPDSLFDACLKLVSENLDLVDSFHGFPSLVGEKIFRKALQTRQIKDLRYAGQAVQLFAEAFGPELLCTLNVAGQHLGLNYYLDQLLYFTDLVSLDVSHCGLGDHHEILTHIANLTSLESLRLCNNHLSDEGIRKLTLAYRMFGRGPHGLTFLDLSRNAELTKGCLKYMSPFPKLDNIYLFDCNCMKVGSYKDWSVRKDSSSAVGPQAVITTCGWASSLVNTWMEEARARACQQPSKKKSFFYSKPTIVPPSETCSQGPNDDTNTFLVAYRCQDNAKPDSSTTEATSVKQSFEEENDLINLYSNNKETVGSAGQKASLLTGLDNSVNMNSQCNTPPTIILSEKILKQSRYRAHSAESSKCAMTLSRTLGKTQCQHKENTETLPKPKSSQPTLHEYCNSGGKKLNDKSKDSNLLPKLTKRQTLSTDNAGSMKLSANENLVGTSNCILKKRNLTEELGHSVAKTTVQADGPKSKRRKIVIVRPDKDKLKLKTDSCAKSEETETQHKLVERSKPGTSFLDSLHKWI